MSANVLWMPDHSPAARCPNALCARAAQCECEHCGRAVCEVCWLADGGMCSVCSDTVYEDTHGEDFAR
jgi:hypothetical protein